MSTFTKMVKQGKIGRVCRFGARLIIALGIIQISVQLYALWQTYLEMQRNLPQQYGYSQIYSALYYAAPSIFGTAVGVTFYVIALYTAGVVLDSFFPPVKSDIMYEPLDKEKAHTDETL